MMLVYRWPCATPLHAPCVPLHDRPKYPDNGYCTIPDWRKGLKEPERSPLNLTFLGFGGEETVNSSSPGSLSWLAI